MSNGNYEVSKKAFNYIIEKKETSLYYEKSILNSLALEYSIFKESVIKESISLNKLIKNYERKIEEIGITDESILTIIDFTHILAFYNKELEKAKNILINILSKKNYSDKNLAYCKLKLGDILLIENDIWEAQL